jgi:hypothetical protein
MEKWLKTGNVRKTRDNEPSTSANVLSGLKCAKSRWMIKYNMLLEVTGQEEKI